MTEKIGKYEIIRTLGKGATAVVYLARDPDTDQQVAVKLIRFVGDNVAVSRRLRKLFQTEDSSGRRLNHPNIVKIYDAHIEDDHAYLVMEYIDGLPLDRWCMEHQLGLEQRLQLFLDICRIVQCLRQCGVIICHRLFVVCFCRRELPR